MVKEKDYMFLKIISVLILCVLFFAYGCGEANKPRFTAEELAQMPLAQRTGLPEASGGFVFSVAGETITAGEVIAPVMESLRATAQANSFEQFKTRAGPLIKRIFLNKVSNILLYNQARKNAAENIDEALNKATEAEIGKFIAGFGGDYARAEEALKEMGMDWVSFRQYQRKMILTQSYIHQKLPEDRPITYREMMDYYNDMKEKFFTKPATLTFRLIDIEAEKLEPTDPNKDRLQLARELADELVKRINAGEDFGELAKQYSHDYRASFRGLWNPVQPQYLAKPYDILAAEAEKIEPGQIAGPIEAGEHIFIMKLEERDAKTVEPFEKVQSRIEGKIMFDRRRETIDKLTSQLMQEADIENADKFIDFCLEQIYRTSNQ
jgi:parvulin-like peptidyl-prolyl isomerase